MRALRLIGDRKLELAEVPDPAAPAEGEVQVRIKAVGLNHLDLWGFRGMAFARRQLPLVVGAEASGEIAAVGPGVPQFKAGQKVVMYGAMTCGKCVNCREGRRLSRQFLRSGTRAAGCGGAMRGGSCRARARWSGFKKVWQASFRGRERQRVGFRPLADARGYSSFGTAPGPAGDRSGAFAGSVRRNVARRQSVAAAAGFTV